MFLLSARKTFLASLNFILNARENKKNINSQLEKSIRKVHRREEDKMKQQWILFCVQRLSLNTKQVQILF